MSVLITLSFSNSRVQKLKLFDLWSKQSQGILVRRMYLQDIGEIYDQVIFCLGIWKSNLFQESSPIIT